MHRFTRALGLLGVGATLGLTLTPLPNVLARALATQAAAGPAEAVVVLASTVHPDGTLTGESLRRALHGILLYEAVGLTIVFLALNLAAGLVVVLVLRAATGQFVSLHAVDDPTWLGFSLLQALAFQRWRESR